MLERSDLFLALARSARAWQLAAVAALAGNVVLGVGFVEMALSSRYVPYLVEVDRHGNTSYAGPIPVADLPEEKLLLQQLRQFVWNLRVVVPDPVAEGELLARAYALADVPVRRSFEEHFARPENDPRTIAKNGTRTVDSITVLRLPQTEATYQLTWKEILLERRSFGVVEERSYQGLATVARAKDQTPEELADNPLGLLITGFTWTETTGGK